MCDFMYENDHDDLPTFHTQVRLIDQVQLYILKYHLKSLFNITIIDLSTELAVSSSNNNQYINKQTFFKQP